MDTPLSSTPGQATPPPNDVMSQLEQVITVTNAITDSPTFRQCIELAQGQVDELEKWVEALKKGTRNLARGAASATYLRFLPFVA